MPVPPNSSSTVMPWSPSSPICGQSWRGKLSVRSISAASGAIFASAKPRTLSRSRSISGPRSKSSAGYRLLAMHASPCMASLDGEVLDENQCVLRHAPWRVRAQDEGSFSMPPPTPLTLSAIAKRACRRVAGLPSALRQAAQERALLVQEGTARLEAPRDLDRFLIGAELLAVFLVSREAREIDQADRGVHRTRELGRQVIAGRHASAALDRRGERLRVGLEVPELVGIERVADVERDHQRISLKIVDRRILARRRGGKVRCRANRRSHGARVKPRLSICNHRA